MRISREERLAALILGMLALLTVVGWLAGRYFVNRTRALVVAPWRDPKAALNWQDIDPLLALRELSEPGSSALLRDALEAGEVETAYATLVYAIDLEPEERCGLLLVLAQSAAQGGRPAIQASCLRMAAAVTTVAAELSDLTRAVTLIEVGRGMADLGTTAEALFYLDQAYAVARFSDRLTMVHRRMILDALIPLYRKLGRKPEAWQALLGQVLTPTSPPTRNAPVAENAPATVPLERPQLLHLSDATMQATAARQRMVQGVLSAAAQGQGGAITDYQIGDLASALRHEDRVRQQSYRASAAGDPIARARDRVAWNVLKSRVARRGFGLSIVPEWEAQVEEIDAALRGALDTLYAQYPAAGANGAQRAVLLLQLEHGLLGFYPDWPQAEWAGQLVRLEPQRALYLSARTENRDMRFYLTGIEP